MAVTVRKNSRKRARAGVFLILILFAMITLIYIFHIYIKPTILTYAKTQAQNAVYQMINSQVNQALGTLPSAYSSFVRLEKDESGRISAITTDMANMNSFKTRVTDAILTESKNAPPLILKIPFYVLLGNDFFFTSSPQIPVKLLPFSSIQASYSDSFSSAGINQTRHQIMMNFKASVNLLCPGFRETVDINIDVLVAETVIVGTTPQVFAGIGTQAFNEEIQIKTP